MKLQQGNYLDDRAATVFLAPCSNALTGKVSRELVMGKGAALEMKQRFPGIAKRLGHTIFMAPPLYGVSVIEWDAKNPIFLGAFQSKEHWTKPSSYALIGYSTMCLKTVLPEYPGDWIFSLAMPGVGLGGLKRELVAEILAVLPDTVHVWYL